MESPVGTEQGANLVCFYAALVRAQLARPEPGFSVSPDFSGLRKIPVNVFLIANESWGACAPHVLPLSVLAISRGVAKSQ